MWPDLIPYAIAALDVVMLVVAFRPRPVEAVKPNARTNPLNLETA